MARPNAISRLLRRAIRSIVTLKGSPRAIAMGAAIGVFIAFTPTVGLQMLLGALVATLVGANRPAAMIPAWITNPVTIPPIYAFTYWLGRFFWKGPPVSEVYDQLVGAAKTLGRLSWYEFLDQFTHFLQTGVDVFIAMMIGGLIVGGVLGAASYPLVYKATEKYQQKLAKRRRRRAEKRAQKTSGAPRGTGAKSEPRKR